MVGRLKICRETGLKHCETRYLDGSKHGQNGLMTKLFNDIKRRKSDYIRTNINRQAYRDYIYVISNPSFKCSYKFGKTENLEARLSNYQTGDPERRYKVEFFMPVISAYVMESKIKQFFKSSIKNEWIIGIELNVIIEQIKLIEHDYLNL